MKKLNILVFTDHSGHSSENSIYEILKTFRQHPNCGHLDVATRHHPFNQRFFQDAYGKRVFATTVPPDFEFREDGLNFTENLRPVQLSRYNFIFLRLPPPLSPTFLDFLKRTAPSTLFINDPSGIQIAGSKRFLLNFPDLCPPIQLLENLEDLEAWRNRFPVVLKPLDSYGGKGIVRIDGDRVWDGTEIIDFKVFADRVQANKMVYLGMQYLKNVSQGDKRILVVDGKVMGASLRLPKEGDWLCNVAQGGHSVPTDVEPEEHEIIRQLDPAMKRNGILIYGVDTLVGDDGQRLLSELNTTSIGGIKQIQQQSGKPIIQDITRSIFQFAMKRVYGKTIHPVG